MFRHTSTPDSLLLKNKNYNINATSIFSHPNFITVSSVFTSNPSNPHDHSKNRTLYNTETDMNKSTKYMTLNKSLFQSLFQSSTLLSTSFIQLNSITSSPIQTITSSNRNTETTKITQSSYETVYILREKVIPKYTPYNITQCHANTTKNIKNQNGKNISANIDNSSNT